MAYHISTMNRNQIDMAIQWAAQEGWNPGLYDADCFYATDPEGFFIGILDESPIAIGSAVIYDESFAFCGFYIVDKSFRGQGYGLQLTKARLARVNTRNAGIDGVPKMLEKYERLGYKIAHRNSRYKLQTAPNIPHDTSSHIALNQIPLSLLSDYDRYCFPALRDRFLKAWINQPQSLAVGCVRDGALKGYGVIRTCQSGFKIGPLFADTPEIADALFLDLASFAQNKELYLDIPENNPEAIALVTRYNMEKVFETARMYLRGEPELKRERIFGITTFELG